MTGREEDIDALSEDKLLALPEANVTPANLPKLRSLHAAALQRRNAEELAREMDPSYTGPRFFTHAPRGEAERRARESEEFLRLYEESMRQARDRSSELLDRIDHEQLMNRKRLEEIDARALTLKDGRKVYVGEDGDYLDREGHKLQGNDKDEASGLHELDPNAATWAERTEVERKNETLRQLRERVETLRDDAGKESGQGLSPDTLKARSDDYAKRLSGYEKEFQSQLQDRTAALSAQGQVTDDSFGGSDYMAAYGSSGRNTSHAATLDSQPNNGTLKKDFAPAALPSQAAAETSSQPATGNTLRVPVATP
jgi:hypothetical protein